MGNLLDCLIVGGGPAGLTAAIYLARYRRKFLLVDAGESRALRIPTCHNLAGFPNGIGGEDLIARMRRQAVRYGAPCETGTVSALRRVDDAFEAEIDGAIVQSRIVLIGTGVRNIDPPLGRLHEAIKAGAIRYCPICDGYEVQDCKIAVLGEGKHALDEAIFLRSYSNDITLISMNDPPQLPAEDQSRAMKHAVKISLSGAAKLTWDGTSITAHSVAGEAQSFDTMYCALGSHARHELVSPLGVTLLKNNCVSTNTLMQTNVAGIYAAGDVTEGLDQISAAMGKAAIAATEIHNKLS